MKFTLNLENDYLPDKYGKYAPAEARLLGQPSISLPLTISELPAEAKFVAFYILDYDAVPVCSFPYIHWSIANLPVIDGKVELLENFSQTAPESVIQGKNSTASPLFPKTDAIISEHYTGPTPPDKDHTYTIYAFAFANQLDLKQGYWLNELIHQTDKALTTTSSTFLSRS